MNAKQVVAVIDDDDGLRKSLVRMFTDGPYEGRSFVSACEFLESPESVNVSCIISDVCMPDMDGFELQRILKDKYPWISIVFITAYGNVPAGVSAIKNGAEDFLESPSSERLFLRLSTERLNEPYH
jgi:two-component system, LuxR family, response regulator FixJ